MISVFGQSVGNSGFEPPSGQTKKTPYIIVICCLSTKHATLKRKSKDWLSRNQNNVSRATRQVDAIISSNNTNCSRHGIAETLLILR